MKTRCAESGLEGDLEMGLISRFLLHLLLGLQSFPLFRFGEMVTPLV